mgnify:CR=1 FL=1
MLKYEELPSWILNLEEDDIKFIKKFIMSSGSLKEMAKDYNITYPTMRIKLDKLIEKVKDSDVEINDSYTDIIKKMALDDKLELSTAKELLAQYRKMKQRIE